MVDNRKELKHLPTPVELAIFNEDERKRVNLIREQYEWPCVIEKKKSNR